MVDKEIAAHQLVDEELFDQGEGRIVIEHTLLLAWFVLIDFWRILLKFALVLSELLLALSLVLRLWSDSLREEELSVTYRIIILIHTGLFFRLRLVCGWRASSGLHLSGSLEYREVSSSDRLHRFLVCEGLGKHGNRRG